MENPLVLAITMMTFGQVGLSISLLVSRSLKVQTYLPLALFFMANGVIASGPAISILLPEWQTLYIATIFPAWLLLGPTLWLYVVGLTSDQAWNIHLKHVYHFIPVVFGMLVMAMIVSLPVEERNAIFFSDQDIESGYPLFVVVSIFLLMLFWAGQSGSYVFHIVKRLSCYQKQLKDQFASNEHRELKWVNWVLVIIVSTWLLSFASLMTTLVKEDSLFGHTTGAMLSLALVWSLAHWGLRQKPGFEGRYLSSGIDQPEEENDAGKDRKYTRSALGDDQSQRIAQKIKAAMEQDNLHLDPAISLHKLAHHVAISPNYISQTLNETMGTNFFDFINKWRIEAAKPKIIANEDSVLNIAYDVGFNARSSFYKVFKRETGNTPSEFRKLHCAESC